jgi:hypothetical protein
MLFPMIAGKRTSARTDAVQPAAAKPAANPNSQNLLMLSSPLAVSFEMFNFGEFFDKRPLRGLLMFAIRPSLPIAFSGIQLPEYE